MFVKVIVVWLSFVKIGLAIHCYDCTSVNNSMCLEPRLYDEETLRNFLPVTECRHGIQAATHDFFCRKIKQLILHKHYEPEVRVMRGCGWKKHEYLQCYTADNEDHLETVCQCFDEFCNSSDGVMVNLGVLFTGLCGILLLF